MCATTPSKIKDSATSLFTEEASWILAYLKGKSQPKWAGFCWCRCPVCGTRKNLRAYALPRFFRPLHNQPPCCICHRQHRAVGPESNRRFDSVAITKAGPRWGPAFVGAADRNRTGTDFTPRDFKSLVSTYSTTTAYSFLVPRRFRFARILSPLCLPVAVPGSCGA